MSAVARDADRRLAALRQARDAVTTNLLDLEADGAYSLLKAGNGLSGVTAGRAKPALAGVVELYDGLQLLDDLVDRAEAYRNDGRFTDDRARQVISMLEGQSITLPPQVRPLAQRGLTDAAVTNTTISAKDLLSAMEQTFAAARDVVAAVDAAWNDLLPRVERADAEALTLASEAPAQTAVAGARAALRVATDRIAQDPLGAAGELARAEALLTSARQAVAQVRALRARVQTELADADALVGRIAAGIDEGRVALEDSRRTVAEPTGLLDPIDPTTLTAGSGLQAWLDRLRALVAAGDVERAADGLAHWRNVADQTLAAVQQVATANAAPAARRRELRGLLRAARAKAVAAGQSDDLDLREQEQAARAALAPPCDLAAAQRRVDDYLAAVRSKRTKRSKKESV